MRFSSNHPDREKEMRAFHEGRRALLTYIGEIEAEIERRSKGINLLPEDPQKIAEPWLQGLRASYFELRDRRNVAKAELEGVGLKFWLKTGLKNSFAELDARFQEMKSTKEQNEVSFIREAKVIAERNKRINDEKRRKVFGNLHLRLSNAKQALEFARSGEEGVCVALIRGDIRMALRMAEIHSLIRSGHASAVDAHEQASYIARYHNPEPEPQQEQTPDLYRFYMENLVGQMKVMDGVWEEVMPEKADETKSRYGKPVQLIEGVAEKEKPR